MCVFISFIRPYAANSESASARTFWHEVFPEKGFPTTGSENYGGPVVTENGLIFISGTKDQLIRAYNRHTGEKLWEAKLPAAAFATPATYMINGKQYVAIACGGEKLGAKKGNEIVAFALE